MKINASGYSRFKSGLDITKSNVLIHGPDETIVNDTAEDLLEHIRIKDNTEKKNKISIKNHSADELVENPELLMDQMDLFADNSSFDLFVISNVKDKHLKLLDKYLNNTPENRGYLLIAPGLNTRSKFVKLFADSKSDYVFGVYDINIQALREYCVQIFKQKDLLISVQDANLLIDYLGYDRKLIKNNAEKVYLYYLDEKEPTSQAPAGINFDECKRVINSKSVDELEKLINDTLQGNITKIPSAYEKTINSGSDYILVLRSFNYRLNRLLQVANALEAGERFDDVAAKISPPIFFKEKDVILSQLRMWDRFSLSRAIGLLYKAELDIKTGKENIHNSIMRIFFNISKLAKTLNRNKIAS